MTGMYLWIDISMNLDDMNDTDISQASTDLC